MITGGCFCGNLKYQIDVGEYTAVNCHCSMCRKISAAPYVAWIIVPDDKFRFTGGNPAKMASSDSGTRQFCSDCGSPITCVNTNHPGNVDITVGSLDKPEPHNPTLEIHVDTKLSWVNDLSHIREWKG